MEIQILMLCCPRVSRRRENIIPSCAGSCSFHSGILRRPIKTRGEKISIWAVRGATLGGAPAKMSRLVDEKAHGFPYGATCRDRRESRRPTDTAAIAGSAKRERGSENRGQSNKKCSMDSRGEPQPQAGEIVVAGFTCGKKALVLAPAELLVHSWSQIEATDCLISDFTASFEGLKSAEKILHGPPSFAAALARPNQRLSVLLSLSVFHLKDFPHYSLPFQRKQKQKNNDMVRLRTSTPLLSSDAFWLLRKTVMPSDSSTSSSSESDSSVSRRSRRSRRERRPAQDRPDRSRSPRRGSRAPDEAEQERLERERRERSRERLERIVEEDRLRREQSEERKRMKVFRNWMTTSLSAPEARNLRDSFIPSFPNSGFDLMSKAEATERSLKAEQYKILDVARPLLFLREKIAESADLKDSPLAEAADTALRLWGHTFHNVTTSRRENLLKVLDPKYLSLLKKTHRFKPRECASLFGRHFIKNMVKEATDDQTLRSISSSHGSSSRPRAGSSGYRGTSRSHRGGNFGQGCYSNGYKGGLFGTFNRSRGNHSIRSENLSLPNYSLDSPPIVGGRLKHFVDSWK
ncbi:hypothetical protein DAPPUDRAFT_105293 [Daphnia pulex]|uniref:Uncharacterized protein n=1 Tax=Daphnia pulex TaxID=6669 RepID=E9GQ16_DAPPU|nr:hypothetical protein DAPPUDRAFT_105293 [Daphnia pulex]|eukprot:EFX78494.1 hypothetical protein DAPPUDRAFT_105293 [Daphnia pulex]